MNIPEFHEYYPIRFSGSSQNHANFYGPKRLYAHGLTYELERFPIIALFDFVWQYKIGDKEKTAIIRNKAIDCPFQLLAVNGVTDYESFTSLN